MHGAMPPQPAVLVQVKRLHPEELDVLASVPLELDELLHAAPIVLCAELLQVKLTPLTQAAAPHVIFVSTPL